MKAGRCVQRPVEHAGGDLWSLWSSLVAPRAVGRFPAALPRSNRERCLLANWIGHAHRIGSEERDSDRRIRQGRNTRAESLWRMPRSKEPGFRLRPILMTSFAFILGCVPLWTATGAGSVARQIMGTTVIGGCWPPA